MRRYSETNNNNTVNQDLRGFRKELQNRNRAAAAKDKNKKPNHPPDIKPKGAMEIWKEKKEHEVVAETQRVMNMPQMLQPLASFVGANSISIAAVTFLVFTLLRMICMSNGFPWAIQTMSSICLFFIALFLLAVGGTTQFVIPALAVYAFVLTLVDFGKGQDAVNREKWWWATNIIMGMAMLAALGLQMQHDRPPTELAPMWVPQQQRSQQQQQGGMGGMGGLSPLQQLEFVEFERELHHRW